MGIFGVIATLALFAVTVQGADLFQGYLIFAAGTPTCYKENSGLTMVAFPNGAPNDCTLVKVSGTETDGFIIEDTADATKQITYAAFGDGDVASHTNTGTALKFVLNNAKLSTAAALTDSSNPFVIDVNARSNTGQECVKGDLAYTVTTDPTTCNALLFYFELADCTGTNCKACLPDPAECSECEVDDALNTLKTECVACSGSTSCTECTLDGSDNILCSACSGANKVESNACVACADGEVPDAEGTACEACPDGQEINDAGTECEDSDDDSDDDTTTASGSGVILPSTAFITMVTLQGKQIFG